MTHLLRHLVLSLAMAGAVATAHAGTVFSYHESLDGDLVREPGQVHAVFELVDGVNLVAGQYGGPVGQPDLDGFSFRVQAGLVVTGLSIELWEELGDALVSATWRLRRGSLTQGVGDLIGEWTLASPSYSFFDDDLGAGDYNLVVDQLDVEANAMVLRQTGHWGLILGASADGGQPLPLPSSLALVVLGLLVLPSRLWARSRPRTLMR